MNTYRKTALWVGLLYITGTVAGVFSVAFTSPVAQLFTQHDPQALPKAAAQANPVLLGSLCILLMGLSLALVPVVIYPVLKQFNRTLALGYVVFRGALETTLAFLMVATWLLIVIIGRQAAGAGTGAASFSTLGAVVFASQDALAAIMEIVFPLGALMLYAALYQARLIPRWLSGWGLVGAVLYAAAGLFHIFVTELTPVLIFLGVQEMVMAVWLIVKGFNPEAISAETMPAIRMPATKAAATKVAATKVA